MIPQQAAVDAKAAQAQTGASDLAAALALAVAGPESGYRADADGDHMLYGRLADGAANLGRGGPFHGRRTR